MSHDHWQTPFSLLSELNERFNFNHDPCPLHGTDGLTTEWKERNFVNPPYNKKDKPMFIKKAYEQSLQGKLCVLLIPVCTSTKQFHELILPNAKIEFIKGRIKFNEYGNSEKCKPARQDHMLVIFDGRVKNDKQTNA